MMRAAWVGTGGESQNHSPLVVAFLVRLGIRSMRAGRESQLRRVRDPVLRVRRFFPFHCILFGASECKSSSGELFAWLEHHSMLR
ncbi:hypothetical protein TNIN_205471 [Trichonephila inaurata madagascariensis]|uniref:Uncharacterized protein n=1 Tax=Trichonephila inaurata madagascariensis TaxID=2747483 RepID=A0A8X7BZ67_9ARAC|nr:hypothetical protein TNIN_205471 [Trichonephila inaurata madagascariensis]